MSKQVLLTNDSGSISLGKLNDNFTELYDDKIEADSTDILTNKSIDGDDNTITDLSVTSLKTSAKTGVATKVITGTAGSTNELGKFNSNGDLVSAGVSTETALSSSSDIKIPTSKAIATYVGTQVGNAKSLFVPVAANNTITTLPPYDTALGNFPVNTADNAENVWFVFRVPDNFTSFSSAKIVMIPDTTETIQWDVDVNYGGVGELYTANSATVSNSTLAVTINVLTEANIASAFTALQSGDYVGVKFNSNISSLRILGLYITYA